MNWDGVPRQQMMGILGPSLAHGKRTFQEFFGTEADLIGVQNLLLDRFTRYRWMSYSVPTNVRREATELWLKTRE
jgi:hypothetical protein